MIMDKKQKKFSKIYDSYVGSIYRFISIKVNSQEIAEDLTSEVFLKTWKSFQQQNKIKNPRAYLYTTARHIVIDFYRTNKEDRTISIEDVREIEDIAIPIEAQESHDATMEIVKQGLNALKEDYQNVVIWRYVDGLSINEIAKILGKSNGATRVLIHRAMEQLKERVQ
ncbi:sigma-70 family RNA polymerase sigma factor [Patescibacteria group bacterium]|nr:sigma-70 family RNA polymerase sigma factor [Patescibacteria group bacterium]